MFVSWYSSDIEMAIKKLQLLGNGFKIVLLGSKKMVQSVPCEMNNDHTMALVLGQVFVSFHSLLYCNLSHRKRGIFHRVSSKKNSDGLRIEQRLFWYLSPFR